MTTANSSTKSLEQRLRRLWGEFTALLEVTAAGGDLALAMEGALLVERGSSEVQAYLSLLSGAGVAADALTPTLSLATSDDMAGAAGAYVDDLNRILINQEWLASATDAEVMAVLAEEFGHSLDSRFNTVDTKGDEGERFAQLLLGLEPSENTQSAFENDTIVVQVGGSQYLAEAATISGKSTAETLTGTSGDDTIITGVDSVVSAAVDTVVTSTGNDVIEVRNSGLPNVSNSGGTDTLLIKAAYSQTRNGPQRLTSISLASTPTVQNLQLNPSETLGHTLTGNDANNVIYGGSGADTLRGGLGKDTLIGGIIAAADFLDPGADSDAIIYTGQPIVSAAASTLAFTATSTDTNTLNAQQTSTPPPPITVILDNQGDEVYLPAYAGYDLLETPNIKTFSRSSDQINLLILDTDNKGGGTLYAWQAGATTSPYVIANIIIADGSPLKVGTGQLKAEATSLPEVTIEAAIEDSTRTITEKELRAGLEDASVRVTSLALAHRTQGTLSQRYTDTQGNYFWIYTPASDDDSSALFNSVVEINGTKVADRAISLDILPLTDTQLSNKVSGIITKDSYSNLNNQDASSITLQTSTNIGPYVIGLTATSGGQTAKTNLNATQGGGVEIGINNTQFDPGEVLTIDLPYRAAQQFTFSFNGPAGATTIEATGYTAAGVERTYTFNTVPSTTNVTFGISDLGQDILSIDKVVISAGPGASFKGNFQLPSIQSDLLVGTPVNDPITGGDLNEVIHALSGDDSINAAGGADLIWAGPGNDSITGGPGNDAFGFRQGDGGSGTTTKTIVNPDRVSATSPGDIMFWQDAAFVTYAGTTVTATWYKTPPQGDGQTLASNDIITEVFNFALPSGISLTDGPAPNSISFL